METALWTVQGLLALVFLWTGSLKAFRYEKAREGLPWARDMTKELVIFIGIAEMAGGLAMVLPGLTGVLPVLTPIAAAGLGLIMLLATGFHGSRGEFKSIPTTVVLLLLAGFVAFGRWMAMAH